MAPDNLAAYGNSGLHQLSGVPVFVYHGLLPTGSSAPEGLSARSRKYWVTADQFRDELTMILRSGGVIASLQDLVDNNRDLQADRPAILTFDDGSASDYKIAFPMLLEVGVQAQFFVNTATVGLAGHLSWSQAREMKAHGMSIHSHGHEHRYLTHCDAEQLRRQLVWSKKTIEDHLGTEVSFLAAPYGDCNRRVLRSVKEAGYRAVCTGRSWPARWASDTIDRTIVYNHTGPTEFERLFSRDVFSYSRRAARAAMISLPKRVWLQLRFRGWQAPGEEALS